MSVRTAQNSVTIIVSTALEAFIALVTLATN